MGERARLAFGVTLHLLEASIYRTKLPFPIWWHLAKPTARPWHIVLLGRAILDGARLRCLPLGTSDYVCW